MVLLDVVSTEMADHGVVIDVYVSERAGGVNAPSTRPCSVPFTPWPPISPCPRAPTAQDLLFLLHPRTLPSGLLPLPFNHPATTSTA